MLKTLRSNLKNPVIHNNKGLLYSFLRGGEREGSKGEEESSVSAKLSTDSKSSFNECCLIKTPVKVAINVSLQ